MTGKQRSSNDANEKRNESLSMKGRSFLILCLLAISQSLDRKQWSLDYLTKNSSDCDCDKQFKLNAALPPLMFPLSILKSGKNGRSSVHKTAAITIASQSAACSFQTSCFQMMPPMIRRSISNNGGDESLLWWQKSIPSGTITTPLHCC